MIGASLMASGLVPKIVRIFIGILISINYAITNESIILHAQRAPSNHENCFPLSLDGRGWG
jgi:hypothetical protein